MAITNRVLSRDGTPIAFEQIGSGPAVVLVDAAGGFRGFGPMRPLAEQLASAFTVWTYDRRGRGESGDTLPYAVDREVEDLGALMEAGGGSAFVYGFSSGAVLALHAAASGLAIPKLALLEPPIELNEAIPPDTKLEEEIAELVAAGRRGDAAEHFQRSIGVPDQYLVGMREAPWWPAMQALAHTLVYDCVITRSLTPARLPSITARTLVINSDATDDQLRRWGEELTTALPDARHRTLKGGWHGVAPEDLAPVLTEFWAGDPAI